MRIRSIVLLLVTGGTLGCGSTSTTSVTGVGQIADGLLVRRHKLTVHRGFFGGSFEDTEGFYLCKKAADAKIKCAPVEVSIPPSE